MRTGFGARDAVRPSELKNIFENPGSERFGLSGLVWERRLQTCIDVLCAMPYEPDPGEDAPAADRQAFGRSQEVRHTIIKLITAHLRNGAHVSWQGHDFDFTGTRFDGGDFSRSKFSGGAVFFIGAKFSAGRVDFIGAEFSGATVDLSEPFAWAAPPAISSDVVRAAAPARLLLPPSRPGPEP